MLYFIGCGIMFGLEAFAYLHRLQAQTLVTVDCIFTLHITMEPPHEQDFDR
jgi:hypothetical protein